MRLCYLFLFLLIGCATKVSESDLQLLNGYWEINKVTFANGETKDFMPSTTIDYIELDGLKGIRKKVQPKFNGTYETSNDAEVFSIIAIEDRYEIVYSSAYESRTERIEQITKENFSVINADTITYTYKRYEPIALTK